MEWVFAVVTLHRNSVPEGVSTAPGGASPGADWTPPWRSGQPSSVHHGLAHCATTTHEERPMLQTIAIILIIMWALGMGTGYALGGLIHLLLVIAIVVFLVRFISGRKVV
jgi:hypothetical protein